MQKKTVLRAISIIIFFHLNVNSINAQNLYNPLRYETKGLVQWACIDTPQVYDYVLRLFPISVYRTDSTLTLWQFVVRSVSTKSNDVEFQFSITAGTPDTIIVIAYPLSKSIYRQVQSLMEKYPKANSEQLAEHVEMIHDTVRVNGNTELEKIVQDISKMKYYLLLADNFSFAVPTYEIFSQTANGIVYYSIGFGGVGEDAERQTLLEWINKTFIILKGYCEQK